MKRIRLLFYDIGRVVEWGNGQVVNHSTIYMNLCLSDRTITISEFGI